MTERRWTETPRAASKRMKRGARPKRGSMARGGGRRCGQYSTAGAKGGGQERKGAPSRQLRTRPKNHKFHRERGAFNPVSADRGLASKRCEITNKDLV